MMKHITNVLELVPGKQYWLLDKKTRNSAHVGELLTMDNNHYFDDDKCIWAMLDCNNAMKRWEIFGPLPHRVSKKTLITPPNFEALLNESQ
jgi:hypothetical protein